jgi:K+-transporting ATPase ATPase A chain
MTANGWLQIVVFAVAVLAVTKPLGLYPVSVYEGRIRRLRPVERALYRAAGIDANEEQHWTGYAAALLLFSAISMLLTYAASLRSG